MATSIQIRYPPITKTKSHSFCLPRSILYCDQCWDIPGRNVKNCGSVQTVKLDFPEEENPSKFPHMIYYFICFQLFLLFCMEFKTPGLIRHTLIHRSLPNQKSLPAQDGECFWICPIGRNV